MFKNLDSLIGNSNTLLSIILILIFPAISKAENHKTDPPQTSEQLYIEKAYSFLKNRSKYDSVLFYCSRGLDITLGNNEKSTAKLFRYKGMAFSRTHQYDSAFVYYHMAIKLNHKLNDLKSESKNLISIGALYYKMEENRNAIKYFDQAYNVSSQINYASAMTQALNNIGASYKYMGNYLEASKYYLQALDIARENKLKTDEANTMGNLANCYGKIGDFDLSKKYHLLEREIFIEKCDTNGLINVCINLGYTFSKTGNKDSALVNYLQGLEYAQKKSTTLQKSVLLSNIAAIYNNKEEYEKGVGFLKDAYSINKKTNREKGLINNNINLGGAYTKLGQFPEAKKHLDEALHLCQKEQNHHQLLDVYNAFATYHNASGNYSKAYNYKNEAYMLSDTLLTAEIAEKMQELQIQYETREKEQQIAGLLHQNEISRLTTQKQQRNLFIVIVLLISVIGVTLLLNRQNILKRKRKESELKHRLFRSQMNPHFIFNALASIQYYIYREKADDAARYLSNFSGLMRDILEGSANETILLEQEINIVSNYCTLQKMRKNEVFDFSIENKTSGEFIIPPMLAQPFIENATLHAFKGIDYKGHIWIRYKTNETNFIIEIEDNGIGFVIDEKQQSKHKSMAIKLTNERIGTLNHKTQKANLSILSKPNKQQGTLVIITIPLEKCLKF